MRSLHAAVRGLQDVMCFHTVLHVKPSCRMMLEPVAPIDYSHVRQEIVALIFRLFSENSVCFFSSLAAALAIQVGGVLAVFER